ncbi:hypothetical protein [Bradyrhizobium sp. 162]|uniref:hypothetical protein n=1 Tax=Bradyrhizobium sp. 162 TaxID=2782635 RepID=UPI001FF92731|nr:hypothetical protein [Bradyrhizobium sp. 162]MCK1632659.1 hypothetical protein [Bradyrhizobium sp. 162]
MAFVTKCPHCEVTRFEVKEIEPVDSTYKLTAIQCVGCGAPIGVMDFWNIGTLLKKQEKQISDLSSRLQNMEHTLSQIAQVLRR